MNIAITKGKNEQAWAMAHFHKQGITKGFLSSLGFSFLKTLYETMSDAPDAIIYIASDEMDCVRGFVAGTTNINKMYKWIIIRKGWLLAILILCKTAHFSTIKNACETLLYTAKHRSRKDGQQAQETVTAELLSIAVDERSRGQNIGKMLVDALEKYFQSINVKIYKVVTYSKDSSSNAFYAKCGFTLNHKFLHHGNEMHEYIKML